MPGSGVDFRASIEQALDYAVRARVRAVHVIAGVPPAGRLARDGAGALCQQLRLGRRAGVAAGIKLVVEPLNPRDAPGYLINTQEQGAAIVEAIGRDRLGLQFDTYHCQIAQGDLGRRLEALMPVIGHMQLGDVPDRHEPGTGEIGWDYLFRHIGALGYEAWIGCEYHPAGETEAGLGWRERYGV